MPFAFVFSSCETGAVVITLHIYEGLVQTNHLLHAGRRNEAHQHVILFFWGVFLKYGKYETI